MIIGYKYKFGTCLRIKKNSSHLFIFPALRNTLLLVRCKVRFVLSPLFGRQMHITMQSCLSEALIPQFVSKNKKRTNFVLRLTNGSLFEKFRKLNNLHHSNVCWNCENTHLQKVQNHYDYISSIIYILFANDSPLKWKTRFLSCVQWTKRTHNLILLSSEISFSKQNYSNVR